MSDKAELLPCPFCGELPTEHWHKGIWRMHHLVHCETNWCPAAPSIGRDGPKHKTSPTRQDAIGIWNRRSAPVVDEAIVERVCAALSAAAGAEWPDGYDEDDQEWGRSAVRAALAAALTQPKGKGAP